MDLIDRLTEGLTLMLVGMLVVFTALSLTALVIAVLNRVDARFGKPATSAADRTSASRKPQPQQLIAVITAAATAALAHQKIVVRSIEPVGNSGD